MMVSKDGDAWTVLAEDVDVSDMHHNKYKGFFALRAGLLSCGKGDAGFSQFRYRNAVPQEKDMSAYLMVFIKMKLTACTWLSVMTDTLLQP